MPGGGSSAILRLRCLSDCKCAVHPKWRVKYGEQVEDQGQWPCSFGDGESRYAVAVCPAQRASSAWAPVWLRSGAVWCLLGVVGRQGDPQLRDPGRGGFGEGDYDARGPAGSVGEGKRDDGGFAGVASVAAGLDRRSGSP